MRRPTITEGERLRAAYRRAKDEGREAEAEIYLRAFARWQLARQRCALAVAA